MTRLLKKLKLKRFVAMLLLVATVLPFFSSATAQKVYAASSANTIQKAYIAMMQGMTTTDSNIAALASTDDLRLLSLFLSNAYIPFLSCLDGEESEESMEVQVEFLVNLGFNKETADQVTRQCYGASLQSARQLYIRWNDLPDADSEDDNPKIGSGLGDDDDLAITDDTIDDAEYEHLVGEKVDGHTPLTYFMLWYFQTTQKRALELNNGGDTEEWLNVNIPVYYKDDTGNFIQCWALNVDTLNLLTLSLYSVKDYYRSSNLPLGNAVFLNEQYDGESTDGSIAISDISLRTNCTVFQNMYVDWVGNIIADCGSSRRIIVPACLNTYTFLTMAGEQKTNAVSAQFINYASFGDYSDTEVEFENSDIAPKLEDFDYYMDYTASSSVKWDNKFWGTGSAGEFGDILLERGVVIDEGKNSIEKPSFFIQEGSIIDDEWDGAIVDIKDINDGSSKGKWAELDSDGDVVIKDEDDAPDPTATYNSSNTFHNFVVYKSTMSSSDTSGSVIADGDLFINGKQYFGTKFTGMMGGFETNDKLDLAGFNPNTDTALLQSIYLTYIYAYCNHTSTNTTFDSATNVVDMKFNNIFPSIQGTLTWEVADTMDVKIKSLVYYLLHPTEGVEYVATMIKNKLSGFFINWHEDMVGGTDSNYTTGMTQYLGFTGYTTVPNLNDVSWLANILSMYNSIIVYFLIIMCIILLCYVLVGNLSLQRGVIGLFMFGVLAFLPPIAITAAVDATNTTSEAIYATKFDYWALNQTEGYLAELEKLENFDMVSEQGVADYVAYLLSQNSVASTGEGGESESSYAGVKVKWLSPKKASETAKLANELDSRINSSNSGLSSFTTMVITNSVAKTNAKEIYLNSDSATYLYRDYMDIYRYASTAYNIGNYFNFPDASHNATYLEVPVFAFEGNSKDGDPRAFWKSNFREQEQYIKVVDGVTEVIIPGGIDESAVNLITTGSGDKLVDYITSNYASILSTPSGNGTYKSFQNDVADGIVETSSLNAISRGFLVNTTDEPNLTLVLGQNYFGANQKAAGLLLGNSYCVELTARNYALLKSYADTGIITYGRQLFGECGLKNGVYLGKQSSVYFGLPTGLFVKGINELVSEGSNEAIDTTLESQQWETYFYSLYTESPFYYFNFNVRDQLTALQPSYVYNYKKLSQTSENLTNLFVQNNQEYFFNLTETAGDGYGELRDFMNMHDLFYYIIPCLRQGNDVVNLFDNLFGMSYDKNTKLTFDSTGGIYYQLHDGTVIDSQSSLIDNYDNMTEEERYDFWKNYNVRTIFNGYTPWLNIMYACDYTEQENITVMGEKYLVTDPLDPTTYFKLDDTGNMISGRYMVFSRSEMAYYGLSWEDLTTVEQKIITIQDNVYKNSLDLMNYYTYSDETLIQAYSMLQLFEFNKEFSQTSLVSEGYVLYPQSYELKAFTYDAYLRMILSNAGGDSLQVAQQSDNTNKSIYTRIMEKTSIFFGIILIINDFISVYLLPALKLFFICFIFILSIMMVIASATKMEFNMMKVVWKSLLAPLLSFSGVSIALAFLVSLFMSDGASGVTRTNSSTISLGDPTMTLIVMLVLNVIVLIIYFKICKKLWKDFVTYTKAIADNIGSAITGAVGKMVGAVAAGKSRHNLAKIARNTSAAGTARQRGMDNSPHSGKSGLGLGGALAGGAVAGAVAGAVDNMNEGKGSSLGALANKYDKKASSVSGAGDSKPRTTSADYQKKAEEFKDVMKNRDAGLIAKAGAGLGYAKNKVGQGTKYTAEAVSGKAKAIGSSVKNNVKNSAVGRGATKVAGAAKQGASRLDTLLNGKGSSKGKSAADLVGEKRTREATQARLKAESDARAQRGLEAINRLNKNKKMQASRQSNYGNKQNISAVDKAIRRNAARQAKFA